MNPNIKYVRNGDITVISTICFLCGKNTEITVPTNQFEDYCRGMFVQDAFPQLSASDREVIASGMCLDCQERFFEEAEERII